MDGIDTVLSRNGMTFQEAADYFRGRIPVTAEVFYSIAEEYRALAFTVGGYTKAQILKRFYEALLSALEEGSTIQDFRTGMNDFLELEGYEGLAPEQADLIFRTNIQTAYNVGHYQQMTDPAVRKLRPFWQYDAVNDSHTRPSHLEMDGRVFPADSPVWDVWFPPNGFKCRCTVKTLSQRQVEQRGLTVETAFPAVAPDPHFGANPAKVRFQPDLTGYPEPLVKAYRAQEKERAPEQAHRGPHSSADSEEGRIRGKAPEPAVGRINGVITGRSESV